MERDEESGLQCHGRRYYAPWLGRWTSADPIGLGDGVNRFEYCHGNPVGGRDPTGLGETSGFDPEGLDENPAGATAASSGLPTGKIDDEALAALDALPRQMLGQEGAILHIIDDVTGEETYDGRGVLGTLPSDLRSGDPAGRVELDVAKTQDRLDEIRAATGNPNLRAFGWTHDHPTEGSIPSPEDVLASAHFPLTAAKSSRYGIRVHSNESSSTYVIARSANLLGLMTPADSKAAALAQRVGTWLANSGKAGFASEAQFAWAAEHLTPGQETAVSLTPDGGATHRIASGDAPRWHARWERAYDAKVARVAERAARRAAR